MKSNYWKLMLFAAGLGAGALLAEASPLRRSEVSAHPAWVLHLDCDNLRPTQIGRDVLAQMDQPKERAKLAVFHALFDFDLRRQVHGLTMYGGSPAPEDAVMVVDADFNPKRLDLMAKAAKGYQSHRYNRHVIFSWIEKKKPAGPEGKPRIYAAIQGQRLVFAKREALVAAALDVLDGAAPSLAAGHEFPELGIAGNDNIIEGGAGRLNLPDSDPNAALFKLARRVQLKVSEHQQQCQGTVTLATDNPTMASQMLALTQGLLFLTKFQSGNPEITRIASALVVTQAGSDVVGNITLPAREVAAMIKTATDRQTAAEAESASPP